jgi:hypothetical protein
MCQTLPVEVVAKYCIQPAAPALQLLPFINILVFLALSSVSNVPINE